MNILSIIKEEYKEILKEPNIEKDKSITYNGDDGRYHIVYGDRELKKLLSWYGYDSFDEIDSYIERQDILKQYYKNKKITIKLLAWHAKEKRSGFGRKVLKRIFDLAKELGIDEFEIWRPSDNAQDILDHYTDKGIIKPTDKYKEKFKILRDIE